MLTNLIAVAGDNFEVSPRDLRVSLNEDGTFPIYFSLPPLEEIQRISAGNISVKENTGRFRGEFQDLWRVEFNVQYGSYEKFKDSTTYLNHLSNLCELAGDMQGAERFAIEARAIDDDLFFEHKIGTLYINNGKLDDAKAIFESLNLNDNLYANMRLGYLQAQRNDVKSAMFYVEKALAIAPDDFGARLFAGALYLATSQHSKAVRSFRVAAEERPNSSPLFVNLAIAQFLLGNVSKALKSLRTAISINPVNKNAVAFFTDLSIREKRPSDALPYLERYVHYEQKDAAMWARLARVHFLDEDYPKTLAALKREASNSERSSVWNNIGVVYWKTGQLEKAGQYFSRALSDTSSDTIVDDLGAKAAIVNTLGLLISNQKYSEALDIADRTISLDTQELLLRDPLASDIYLAHLFLLSYHGMFSKMHKEAIEILNSKTAARLRFGVLANLLIHYTIDVPEKGAAIQCAETSISELRNDTSVDERMRDLLWNNVVFTLLESGQIDRAEEIVNEIQKRATAHLFLTATLGLLELKKGNIERGRELYAIAVAKAPSLRDKNRIQQKMNLELGRAWAQRGNASQARRYLIKVKKIANSVPTFQTDATAILSRLPHKQ